MKSVLTPPAKIVLVLLGLMSGPAASTTDLSIQNKIWGLELHQYFQMKKQMKS